MLCIVGLVSSCVSRGTVGKVDSERDSLAVALQAKDSLLAEVFTAMNAISENLTAIKSRENLLSIASGDGAVRPAEQIRQDIADIDRLLQENRTKIDALERSAARLRQAKMQIKGLEQMIVNLHAQLDAKDEEIGRLREHLAAAGRQVETLHAQVTEQGERIDQLSDEKEELQADVADKTSRLYTVYYIVGPERELIDAQIVRKSGFIGRTLTVNEKRSLDSFTQGDTRFLQQIPVGRKNVTVVTNHPEDSYRWVEGAGKEVAALEILDPDRFWESSKILVISHK